MKWKSPFTRPRPSVGDHDSGDAFGVPAREVQADGAAPVGEEDRDVLQVEVVHQRGEVPGVRGRMMVLRSIAASRQTEPQVVGRDAAEPVPELCDEMTELEGPARVPVYEHDRSAGPFVQVVHAAAGSGEVLALERVERVGDPLRTRTGYRMGHGANSCADALEAMRWRIT